MKYGTRTYGKASRTTRFLTGANSRRGKAVSAARAATVKRKTNTAVARIQRKPYVPQKRKNTASIVTLARQVKSLQMAQLGSKQRKTDGVSLLTTSNSAAGNTKRWTSFYPLAFAVNDITEVLYTGESARSTANLFSIADYSQVTKSTPVIYGTFDNIDITAPKFENCDFWQDYYADHVSNVQYSILSMKVTMNFQISMGATDEDIWIRVDTVSKRSKNLLEQSEQHMYTLPDALGGFNYLARINATQRNKINYAYFKRECKTRWVKMANNTGVAKTINKSLTIYVPCDGKPFTPDLHPDANPNQGNSRETWYTNTPLHRQQWMILNTTDFDHQCHVSVTREFCWRDPSGTVPAAP